MRKLIVAISVLTLGASFASADPVEDREALMKANAKAMGGLSSYVKGEKPFDAQDVMAQLTKLSQDAQALDNPALWPAGSDAGSEASPKIWEDPEGFQAALAKFKSDTAAAVAAAPADVDALKAQIGAIGSNCASCHQAFRVKKG
jgi:cytochrome c556